MSTCKFCISSSGGLDRLSSRPRCLPRRSHRRLPRNFLNRCFCNLTLTFDLRVKNVLLEQSFFTDPNTYVAGASGGVYSLIAAHLATVLINWSEDSTVKIRKVLIWLDSSQLTKQLSRAAFVNLRIFYAQGIQCALTRAWSRSEKQVGFNSTTVNY